MKDITCSSLQVWRNGTPLPHIETQNQLLHTTIHQQDNLSWYSFICSFMAKGWRLIQQEHLKDIGSQGSPVLLITKLQRIIWIFPGLSDSIETIIYTMTVSRYIEPIIKVLSAKSQENGI